MKKNAAAVVQVGIVPIVRVSSSQDAFKVAEAILAGGIPAVEITMTVPRALQIVEKLADQYGDKLLLGAGTILDPETARAAILAGADFLVSPNLNLDVVKVTKRYGKVSIPAGLTPTEVVAAWDSGADFVKVFPCSAVGGAKYIKALKGPFPQIEMIPTGGVTLETAAEFFKAGAAAVAVGTELVDAQAVKEGRFKDITAMARKFAAAVASAKVPTSSKP